MLGAAAAFVDRVVARAGEPIRAVSLLDPAPGSGSARSRRRCSPHPRLSDEVGVEIWLKRDDLTGLGLGGNKVRGLEYLLADAQRPRLRHAGHRRRAAVELGDAGRAGARTRGMDTVLVCYGDPVPPSGNMLLAEMIGAEIRFTGDPDRASVDRGVDEAAAALDAAGRRAYPLGRGGATAVGALGYVAASLELSGQLRDLDLAPAELWLAVGSCGTHGRAAGRRGVAAARLPADRGDRQPPGRRSARQRIDRLAGEAAALIGGPQPPEPPVIVGGHVGPGYGRRSRGRRRRGAAGRPDRGRVPRPGVRRKGDGRAARGDQRGAVTGPVIFLVSGGAPTLFTTPALAP